MSGLAALSSAAQAAIGLTGVGGLIGAGGTLASGYLAKQADYWHAALVRQNAAMARAQAQRGALDTQLRTSMLESESVARAAASGVSAGFGSPVTNMGEIAGRGEYQALTQMARGENEARDLEAQAAGARYSGNAQMLGADLAAVGTIAGGAASVFRTYGGTPVPIRLSENGREAMAG